MLSRRGFASCALCAVGGLVASDASAQTAPQPAPQTSGVRRTIISQTDGPAPGYVTYVVAAEIEPGATVARHTHPGIESDYILEGVIDFFVEGQERRTYKAGDGYLIPAKTPHGTGPNTGGKIKIVSTYVLEKGKPFASPA